MLLRLTFFAAIVIAGISSSDIWSYTDEEGVVHYTNIRPKKKGAKKVMSSSSGRTSTKSAKSTSRKSCERCDAVPARDRSKDRYTRYDAYILEAAALYQLPQALIRAVIRAESDYDPRVVSAVGARGLMQLMPSVVKDMGVRNVHDPRENIMGGSRLLRILANRYQGDLVLTIAAYHAGPGSLRKYNDTVPPYKNTRKYLRMVLKHYSHFKKLYPV